MNAPTTLFKAARRIAWALTVMLCASAAQAHDTWFASRAARLPGTVVLALGTGNQFPRQEFSIGIEQMVRQGCRQGDHAVEMAGVAQTATALLLRAQAGSAATMSCWAQLMPFEIELDADKVAVYLDEINASAAVRERWRELAARGRPWRERYVKHARIEVPGAPRADAAALLPTSVPMAMDIVLQVPAEGLQPGAPLRFEVRRDGAPLPDFAIELRGSTPADARWLRTDANGRVGTVAPAAGRWVLRGTDLRASSVETDAWESRFVTLAFDVRPR